MRLDVYTDGACSGNPGRGGYSFIIVYNGEERLRASGVEEKTTNNRMELKAIAKAMKHLRLLYFARELDVYIFSDSAYCINPITKGWMSAWKANGWKTKNNEDIKNRDLWEAIDEQLKYPKITYHFIKVKGHSGVIYNELVDYLAKGAIKRLNSKKNYQAREVQK